MRDTLSATLTTGRAELRRRGGRAGLPAGRTAVIAKGCRDFTFNEDMTISPTKDPTFVLGVQLDGFPNNMITHSPFIKSSA